MSEQKKWPRAELHHGHDRLVFGCQKCMDIARGWVCVCGCPNPKLKAECKSCGESRSATRQRCRHDYCEHSRGKHEQYSGKCETKGCPCGWFKGPVTDGKIGA